MNYFYLFLNKMSTINPKIKDEKLQILTQFLSGILAGITSTSITYPFNNIRLRSIEK